MNFPERWQIPGLMKVGPVLLWPASLISGGLMTPYHLFLVLLIVYIGILVATGLYFSKQQKNLVDFWLAGKQAGWMSLGFSAAASWLTAGAILAVTGFFLLQGMGSIWGFVAPNIIALVIIGLLTGKIKKLPSITQPELLEMRYGGFIRLPVAIIIGVVMILFAVADIKGFAMVLQIFYGVEPVHAALIVGLAVAVYVTLGGLSAVIVTDILQFLCLAFFVLIMAGAVLGSASSATATGASDILFSMPESWWNPMSIGLPMVLVFILAIIPGWITEQDPWQRVWAAKSEKAARGGMFFGAALVTLVFGGCAVIAAGLNSLYPEIAEMGFPMGMAKAEPALLTFILDSNLSSVLVALYAVALATAAMSCADTFAASGGSCLARDIYQRYVRPEATMTEMRLVNRFAVLVIVASATAGSFLINSIIDAIHIATFIASASYFFALMGGLYWKRANGAGATASLCTGFVIQVVFVAIDLIKTPPMAPPYLESIHPIFMGHGVILAMALSGVVFVAASLLTRPCRQERLALFFADSARQLQTSLPELSGDSEANEEWVVSPVMTRSGGRLQLDLAEDLLVTISWRELVARLQTAKDGWYCEGGIDTICRYIVLNGEKFIRTSVTRGDGPNTLWFSVEAEEADYSLCQAALVVARNEVHGLTSVGAQNKGSEGYGFSPAASLLSSGK